MMYILGLIIIPLAFCTIFTVSVYRRYRASTADFPGKLAICIVAVGILAFVAPWWLNAFPLDLELPNTLLGDRLTGPDGRVFIVSPPISRVQRYGPEGFEKGFMVVKVSRSAMSASGNVLICGYGDELVTYTPDGAEVPPRGSCRNRFIGSFSHYPSKAKVPMIAFNWFWTLAVPLWHPVMGWAIGVLGILLLKLNSPPRDGSRQETHLRGKPEPVPPAKQPLRKRIATLWNDGLYPREPNH